jgi:hypothetical protein
MNEEKALFHYRDFLNSEEGAAIVEAKFTRNSWTNRQAQETTVSFDGTLNITDCSRSVSLDASFSTIEDARRVVRKLDRLLDAVQGMRDAAARAATRTYGRKV